MRRTSASIIGGRLAVGLLLKGRREAVVMRGDEADRAEFLARSPAQHHLAKRSWSPVEDRFRRPS
jgi:hypothetical protein